MDDREERFICLRCGWDWKESEDPAVIERCPKCNSARVKEISVAKRVRKPTTMYPEEI